MAALQQWYRDLGDASDKWRLLELPLNPTSVVLDVGAFDGEWAQRIVDLYDANVQCFEPVPAHLRALRERFADRPKVKVHEFGLSDRDETLEFTDAGASSSLFGHGSRVTVRLRDIVDIFREGPIDHVDLLKLNVEGFEFQVLPQLIASGLIRRCDRLLVQFHSFVPAAGEMRRRIQQSLRDSHEPVYDYPWVWEHWRLRERQHPHRQ